MKQCSFCSKEHKKIVRGLCPTCYSRERWRRLPADSKAQSSKVANKKSRLKLKAKLFAMLDYKCACCNEAEKEFLCLDHILGNGSEHREGLKSNYTVYRRILKEETQETIKGKYQLLCWNCNASMGMYGYCPHGNLPTRIVKTGKGDHHVGLLRQGSANWEGSTPSKRRKP